MLCVIASIDPEITVLCSAILSSYSIFLSARNALRFSAHGFLVHFVLFCG